MQAQNKEKNSYFITFLILLTFLFLILLNINSSVVSVKRALTLWAGSVLPTLFPFMFITGIMSLLNQGEFFKTLSRLFQKVFSAPAISGYIFFMSALCGYPIGAKICGEYSCDGLITETNANKVLTFCSLTGPVFCIGTVGLSFMGDTKLGFLLYIVQFLSALVTGLVFKNAFVDKNDFLIKPKTSNNILYQAMTNSILNILVVGGYIVIFSLIIDLIFASYLVKLSLAKISLLFSLNTDFITAFFEGIVEMTRGIRDITLSGIDKKTAFVTISFLLSFSGLSVFLQSFAFLNNINKLKYFFSKLVQSIISVFLALFIVLFGNIL